MSSVRLFSRIRLKKDFLREIFDFRLFQCWWFQCFNWENIAGLESKSAGQASKNFEFASFWPIFFESGIVFSVSSITTIICPSKLSSNDRPQADLPSSLFFKVARNQIGWPNSWYFISESSWIPGFLSSKNLLRRHVWQYSKPATLTCYVGHQRRQPGYSLRLWSKSKLVSGNMVKQSIKFSSCD